MNEPPPKELIFVGSSRKDLQVLPRGVRRTFGVALYAAQLGGTPEIAKF
jgi:phage-related protein